MSLRDLIDSECGGANSLVQLTSHFTSDRAKRDELSGIEHAHPSLFTSAEENAIGSADQMVQQFLEEMSVPQTFRMDSLLQEMRAIEGQSQIVPPIVGPTVKDQLNDSEWALQYLEDGKNFNEHNIHEDIWNENLTQDIEQPSTNENYELGFGPNWVEGYLQEQAIKELPAEESDDKTAQDSAKELLNTLDDPKFAYSKFMKFMRQIGDGEVTIDSGNVIENFPVTDEEQANNWATEYSAGLDEARAPDVDKQDDNYDDKFWKRLQNEWMKVSDGDVENQHPWLNEFSDYYDPYKNYVFSDENPMVDEQNPLELGKEKLQIGDIPSAVLCFEAAVKQDENNAEAWQLLGTTQAENEQDPHAIPALKKCLQLDPTNLTALMALAVSYTNENYQNQACNTLITWLKNNPKYVNLIPPDYAPTESVTSLLSDSQHKKVEDIFIRAVQRNPSEVDYEIQCCLGVLFNLSGEFDKAADCFRTALQVKPDDSRLWNRLGATLANGSHPEEAVEAYHHSLNLAPGFIRARYNVGITCINLGAHREAAEHFLTALNQQAKGRIMNEKLSMQSQMSDTIWSTLRMCCTLMDRRDLRPALDNRDLNALNEAFNINDVE